MPVQRMPRGIRIIVATVKISDMPTASQRQLCLRARAAAATAMAAETPQTEVAAAMTITSDRLPIRRKRTPNRYMKTMTTGVHQPGDEQSRRPEAQDVAEEHLRPQQHETCLDVELAAQGRPEPLGRSARVRDGESDQQGPEGVAEAGGAHAHLVGQGVGGDGQHEQGNECLGLAAGGVSHDLHGERGEGGHDDPQRRVSARTARERLGRQRRPTPDSPEGGGVSGMARL